MLRYLLVSLFGAAFSAAAAAQVEPGWREIKPGGETMCAHGGEFSFFVYEGSSDKVLVDFLGGGACWDAKTCDDDSILYSPSLDIFRTIASWGLVGIYDHTNPDNPYKDWTHVVVPYCTGDLHWGSADVTYTRGDGSTFVIRHRGAVNARAALDWVQENLAPAKPEKLNVTGCSAGSYGSSYWTPHLRETFPEARMRQFGESGTGVMPPGFRETIVPLWNVTANAPRWVDGLGPDQVDWTKLSMTEYYIRMASYYPDVQFAEFSAASDVIQSFFYSLMGGKMRDWADQMKASFAAIREKTPNFRSFMVPGKMHCSTITNTYNPRCGRRTLRSWLNDYANSDEVPEDEACSLP